MYIKLSANQWFDGQGYPLVAGRVSVYYYGSDTLADIYSMYHDEFVPVENPVTLSDEGRSASIWFPATMVTVKVEKFNQLEGSYELVSTYTDGFTLPETKNDTLVYGMDALADANPDLGTVTVVGYDNASDCGPRAYVWDPTCTDTADGGCIIESNSTQTGRWLLLSDLRELPSSYYGVTPENDANLAALLGHPSQAGQWGIKFPPVVRIEKGNYTTAGYISSLYPISFDPGAKFVSATITCPNAEISGNLSYVANLEFTSPSAEAHSSWFRTLDGFWGCGAHRFIIDDENYFASNQVTSQHTLDSVTIEGANRITASYINGAYLLISNSNLVGMKIFAPNSDYIKFYNMDWYDHIWTTTTASSFDFGQISQGNHIEFLSNGVNNQNLSQFSRTSIYVKMREAQITAQPASSTVLDLEGRTLGSFSSGKFSKLMNCHVTGNVTLTNAVSGFTMENVVVDGQVDFGTNLVFNKVTAKLVGEWTGSLVAYDSILSGNVVTGTHNITVIGGRWRKGINNATDNTTNTGTILFRDCVLDGVNNTIKTKNLNMINCDVSEQIIEIYPFWDADNNRFLFNGRIEGCTVTNTTPIAYKIFHGLGDGCKDCALVYTWINNGWYGNDKGITMEFWVDTNLLTRVLADSGHYVVYSGNSGHCPLEAWHGTVSPVSWIQCAFYPAEGEIDSPLTNYYRANISMRAVPNWNHNFPSRVGTYGSWIGPAYEVQGGATIKGYLYATNPLPASLGYGDAFDSIIVRYGSSGEPSVIYV